MAKNRNRPGLTVVATKVEDLQKDIRQNRRSYIGGSDAGSILGLNRYCSPYTLWCEKVGMISGEIEDNDSMRCGRDLEDYVAHRFMERTGKRVRRDNMRYSLQEYPFMVGHIDRWIISENAGLECKTSYSLDAAKLYRAGQFPDHYYAQCQHYMAVTGADKWYLAVLCLQHFYMFEIQRDEEEINALIHEELSFWEHVLNGTPPEVDGSESTTETLLRVYPAGKVKAENTVVLTDKPGIDIAQYFEIKKQIKELEGITASVENLLKSAMGEAERGILGDYVITWPSVTSKRFDTKALKTDHPAIYEKYLKESSSRRFTIKEIKRKEITV